MTPSISTFYDKLFTLLIKKLVFYLPHLQILGAHHRGKEISDNFTIKGHTNATK